ncbi:hypothetical protein NDU88_000223 [Pleurodeles waltl]|uniref:Uncharacterized protein n=1 Tax=Pleurodeles waltl TaxID=8319 RepID=A0AAV7U4S3_PLEWA|nr:hypothetical protein NDU88_000223 [Pleurodeles waltl]
MGGYDRHPSRTALGCHQDWPYTSSECWDPESGALAGQTWGTTVCPASVGGAKTGTRAGQTLGTSRTGSVYPGSTGVQRPEPVLDRHWVPAGLYLYTQGVPGCKDRSPSWTDTGYQRDCICIPREYRGAKTGARAGQTLGSSGIVSVRPGSTGVQRPEPELDRHWVPAGLYLYTQGVPGCKDRSPSWTDTGYQRDCICIPREYRGAKTGARAGQTLGTSGIVSVRPGSIGVQRPEPELDRHWVPAGLYLYTQGVLGCKDRGPCWTDTGYQRDCICIPREYRGAKTGARAGQTLGTSGIVSVPPGSTGVQRPEPELDRHWVPAGLYLYTQGVPGEYRGAKTGARAGQTLGTSGIVSVRPGSIGVQRPGPVLDRHWVPAGLDLYTQGVLGCKDRSPSWTDTGYQQDCICTPREYWGAKTVARAGQTLGTSRTGSVYPGSTGVQRPGPVLDRHWVPAGLYLYPQGVLGCKDRSPSWTDTGYQQDCICTPREYRGAKTGARAGQTLGTSRIVSVYPGSTGVQRPGPVLDRHWVPAGLYLYAQGVLGCKDRSPSWTDTGYQQDCICIPREYWGAKTGARAGQTLGTSRIVSVYPGSTGVQRPEPVLDRHWVPAGLYLYTQGVPGCKDRSPCWTDTGYQRDCIFTPREYWGAKTVARARQTLGTSRIVSVPPGSIGVQRPEPELDRHWVPAGLYLYTQGVLGCKDRSPCWTDTGYQRDCIFTPREYWGAKTGARAGQTLGTSRTVSVPPGSTGVQRPEPVLDRHWVPAGLYLYTQGVPGCKDRSSSWTDTGYQQDCICTPREYWGAKTGARAGQTLGTSRTVSVPPGSTGVQRPEPVLDRHWVPAGLYLYPQGVLGCKDRSPS